MSSKNLNRRAFLAATAAASFTIVKAKQVRGTEANSSLRLGLLGCGGRGTSVAGGFLENTGTRIHALADLFEDQARKAKHHFDRKQVDIDPGRVFTGPDAYREICAADDVDFVLISSPPYFHPEHLREAVAAGKHVYCEKPVAVDVPGCLEVMKIGEQAQGKLSLDVGFQIRNAPPFVALTKRIQEGQLGTVASAQVYYYSGAIGRPDWPGASAEEARLRNWVWDRVLSGDIIVEQNIHVIDVCNWVLDGHPEKASASGGRKVATNTGDCYDHYNVVYTYPGGINVTFGSTQYNKGWWDVCERFFGSKGVSEAHYSQPVAIYGEQPWDYFAELAESAGEEEFSVTGSFGGALEHADPEKQKAYVHSILSGDFHNQARQGADSALSAMLGREAAYAGKVMTWDELLSSGKSWDAGLDLAKMVE